jgi:hypothetical protein
MKLELVEFMPSLLNPGILYVSEKYRTAAHLCACGCGEKVRTQLGPLGWEFREDRRGPTLFPSIGNWQKPCRSHYYIRDGAVLWQESWSDEEVAEGRRSELMRRNAYFSSQSGGWWRRFRRWLTKAP